MNNILNIVTRLSEKIDALENKSYVPIDIEVPQPEPKKTIAEIIKENIVSNPIVVLRPKDKKQLVKITTEEIQKVINPSTSKITNMKTTASGGGVIISCKDKESIKKCSEEIQTKLGEKYDINIPKKRNAQIKIVGLNNQLKEEDLIEKIESQNHVLHANSKISLVNMKKNGKGRIIATIETDEITHNNIIEKEILAIGWRECRVYENVPIARCFKCQRYNHVSKYCEQQLRCGVCAGSHDSNDCNRENICCANCLDANTRFHLNIDVNHCVWQTNCSVYQRVIESKKRKLQFYN